MQLGFDATSAALGMDSPEMCSDGCNSGCGAGTTGPWTTAAGTTAAGTTAAGTTAAGITGAGYAAAVSESDTVWSIGTVRGRMGAVGAGGAWNRYWAKGEYPIDSKT